MTLGELVAAFHSATLPRAEWTHLAHLRVGAFYVHQYGAEAALERLRASIRRLNEQHGTVNSANSGYHETITAAYVRLIDEFLRASDAQAPLDERVEALVAGPLGEKTILLRFWSKDLLWSERARAEWVPPDVLPLTAAHVDETIAMAKPS
jgi:hypothetical protein